MSNTECAERGIESLLRSVQSLLCTARSVLRSYTECDVRTKECAARTTECAKTCDTGQLVSFRPDCAFARGLNVFCQAQSKLKIAAARR